MHFTYTFANLISLKFFDSESIFFFTFMCSWTIWKIEVPLCVQFCWDFKWVLLNSKLLYHSWTNEKNFSYFLCPILEFQFLQILLFVDLKTLKSSEWLWWKAWISFVMWNLIQLVWSFTGASISLLMETLWQHFQLMDLGKKNLITVTQI